MGNLIKMIDLAKIKLNILKTTYFEAKKIDGDINNE